MIWIAAVLVLQPMLEHEGTLRLATTGTGLSDVEWLLDGKVVGTTRDAQALDTHAAAGPHTLVARTESKAEWHAMARLQPDAPGVLFVPAWSAHHDAETRQHVAAPSSLAVLGAVAASVFVRSRRHRKQNDTDV